MLSIYRSISMRRLSHLTTPLGNQNDTILSHCFTAASPSQAPSSSIPFGLPPIDSSLPCNGLQRGALHEFFYNDPLEPYAVASTSPALLAYNSHASLLSCAHHSAWQQQRQSSHIRPALPRILWIGKRSWPSPPALAALSSLNNSHSHSLFEHSIFIDPQNDASTLWAIDLALRSCAIDLVIAACPPISRTTTQRLSLAAQKYGTTALLLRTYNSYTTPSCAASRWVVTPTPTTHSAPSWKLSLTKLRGGLLVRGEWLVHINPPDLFTAPQQLLSAAEIEPALHADAHDVGVAPPRTQQRTAL